MNKTVRIIVTILGGWFGLHKFIDKKIWNCQEKCSR